MEKLINLIVKQADLSFEEAEMLLHDINNLRGDEWVDIVEECCTEEVLKEFKELINYTEDEEENFYEYAKKHNAILDIQHW